MFSRRTLTVFAAAVVAVGVLAGCSSQIVGTPTAAPVTGVTAEAWAEQFCQAVKASIPPRDLADIGTLDPADPSAVSNTLTTVIGSYSAGISAFERMPASPVPAGDTAVAQFKDALIRVRGLLTSTRDKIAPLSAADPATAAKVSAAVASVRADFRSSKPDLSGLKDPQLQQGARAAATCKAIGGLR